MPGTSEKPTVTFMGLPILCLGLDKIKEEILSIQEYSRSFHLVNAFTLNIAEKSPSLHSILKSSYLLCDGAPLAIVLSKRNPELKQVRGPDLMRAVLIASPPSISHFFLGGTDKSLNLLLLKAKELNPDLRIAGAIAPPFQDDFASSILEWSETISMSLANIVWIGLGTPKQDYVAYSLSRQIPITTISVGAAFDFISEVVPESPKFLQKLYLEWFYRLIKEPKRLWRRYLIGNFVFLRICVKEVLRTRV